MTKKDIKKSPNYEMENSNQNIVNVDTGEVKIGTGNTILRSNAIGSCVVISAYDSFKKIGGQAHTMIPGTAPKGNENSKNKYAGTAIKEMLKMMIQVGAKIENIEACIVGGGNVLNRDGDSICCENIKSVIKSLNEKNIKIIAKDVGGTVRRSVSFDIEKGIVNYSKGDSGEKLLWNAFNKKK